MGRRRGSLVALAAVAALGDACAPDLPRAIRIEAHFTDAERALAAAAVDEANARLGEPMLGAPVLTLGASFPDSDGFTYDDFGDGIGVIYPLDPASKEYRWLAETNARDYEGYATLADVLIAVRLSPQPTDAERAHFKQVVMHELGHYLGLPHADDRNSIMYSGPGRLEIPTYTAADQQTFCLVYGC